MPTLTQIRIGDLQTSDLSRGFLETLSNLSTVELTPEEALPILESRRRSGIRTFVAREDEQVVGTATLIVEQKFLHSGGWVGHIEDVAVHRNHQKKGIGAALVRHAVDEAHKLGCYKVILSCFEDRIPFYKGLGFQPHDVGMRKDL
jgi:glucosamine-phosphate N-acetyltransferase